MAFSRRKLFDALTLATGGIFMSMVSADRAVAIVFDDQEYLNERRQRLTAHMQRLEQEDAERAVFRAEENRRHEIVDRYLTIATRATGRHEVIDIKVPLEHYDMLCKNNVIDFVPNAEGKLMIPVLCGQPVKIV